MGQVIERAGTKSKLIWEPPPPPLVYAVMIAGAKLDSAEISSQMDKMPERMYQTQDLLVAVENNGRSNQGRYAG